MITLIGEVYPVALTKKSLLQFPKLHLIPRYKFYFHTIFQALIKSPKA